MISWNDQRCWKSICCAQCADYGEDCYPPSLAVQLSNLVKESFSSCAFVLSDEDSQLPVVHDFKIEDCKSGYGFPLSAFMSNRYQPAQLEIS